MAGSKTTHANEAARRYASALFELAQDKGDLANVHKDFKAFAELAQGSEDLMLLLGSPAFSREDKVKALAGVSEKAGLSPLFGKFLGTMAQNGRSGDILGAAVAFDELYAKQRGVKRAVVRTAKEMSGAERQRIESILAKAVGGEVELTSEVDSSLIGGIQLRIGSQLIDASLAAKLERMNTAMKGA
ncbi:ATP synthase F1 subunit delta [uncultured Hyphomonas sp.]|uniref:ATP synthase F1 subunit delta n=1 Tax=uncultured Hyphomonas sp. TaxID=225298 RepID=UPI002AAB1AF2|nr:ATP synthase F1 subunit delta [uncultured Hyphomonas sp.]